SSRDGVVLPADSVTHLLRAGAFHTADRMGRTATPDDTGVDAEGRHRPIAPGTGADSALYGLSLHRGSKLSYRRAGRQLLLWLGSGDIGDDSLNHRGLHHAAHLQVWLDLGRAVSASGHAARDSAQRRPAGGPVETSP